MNGLKLMKYLEKSSTRLFFLFLFSLISYWYVLPPNIPVNPDAQYILEDLQSNSGLLEYLGNLVSFKTLDFQPIRDLSLMLDLKIYFTFNFYSIILQNLFWWVLSCWILGKVLRNIFPEMKWELIFLISLGFVVYPLFSQSITWGIARKHILSFFFIMIITEIFTRGRQKFSFKDSVIICVCYTCSILSQPISLLWPIWAFCYLLIGNRKLLKTSAVLLITLSILLCSISIINIYYYKLSPAYLEINTLFSEATIDLSDKVLVLGHYVFQIFYPYLLVFNYTLGHYSTLIGLLLLVLLIAIPYFLRVDLRKFITWLIFAFLPLVMVMRFPQNFMYDTYLLIPSVGVLIVLLFLFEKLPLKYLCKIKWLLIPLILFWTYSTRVFTRAWLDEKSFARNSFELRPSCMSAATYLLLFYENEASPPASVKKYLYHHECKESYGGGKLMKLQTLLLFYEEDLVLKERIEKLKGLASFEVSFNATYVSFFIKNKLDDESAKALLEFKERWKKIHFENRYLPLVVRYIQPYCKTKKDLECLEMIKPFLKARDKMFYH
jgi:hypothetical protein